MLELCDGKLSRTVLKGEWGCKAPDLLDLHMKFTITYNVENHGWAEANLQCDGESYTIDSISYLSDAFTELSQAIMDVLNGLPESDCGFDHEPGRTKLRFMIDGEVVLIQVYEFDSELIDEPWDKGSCVKSFRTRVSWLKSQYLEEADKIIENIGVKEYKNRWGYPFPLHLYEKIKTSKKGGS